jgi:F0F1-type ATP synthase assembly protein I
MPNPHDDRPAWVIGMEWATQVMTIAIEMAVPGLAGYWLDTRLGTKVLFLIVGVALGFILGLWQLLRLVNPDRQKKAESPAPPHKKQ